MEFLTSSQSLRRVLATAAWSVCGAIFSLTMQPELLASPTTASPKVYPSIRRDLKTGRANDAISLLQLRLANHSTDAAAHDLLCRVYLQEERWPDAEQECEQAVRLEPNNSNYHLWLGRAYGGAAAHASLRSAYSLARKVHAEFETAVRLDPKNLSALSDLGEYDVDVPRLIGGGLEHAQQIAQQLAPLDASRCYELQAKIAEKNSDFSAAEKDWKLAIQTSRYPAEQWMNLAGFYADRKNFSAMLQAIENGVAADPAKGIALVQAATLLIQNHQNIPRAEQLLQQYLASSQQSEDAPAFQVDVQLGNLLASQGDRADAQREYAAARALASNYAPAQQATRGA